MLYYRKLAAASKPPPPPPLTLFDVGLISITLAVLRFSLTPPPLCRLVKLLVPMSSSFFYPSTTDMFTEVLLELIAETVVAVALAVAVGIAFA